MTRRSADVGPVEPRVTGLVRERERSLAEVGPVLDQTMADEQLARQRVDRACAEVNELTGAGGLPGDLPHAGVRHHPRRDDVGASAERLPGRIVARVRVYLG